jgi:DNA-binding CsgD family transcriptional regulator
MRFLAQSSSMTTSGHQIEHLKKALKSEREPIVRQRIQIVLLREDGKTQPEIADIMGVSLSTVNRTHMAYETKADRRTDPTEHDTGGGKIFLNEFAKAAESC